MHIPVLLKEVLEYLDVKPGGKYIDATFGAGGHSKAIAERGGEVLGIDRDIKSSVIPANEPESIRNGSRVKPGMTIIHGNFADIGEIAREHGFTEVDGILFDLGLSSDQLDDPARGFSFQKDGPLDMRMGKNSSQPPLWKRGGAAPSLLQREGRGEFTADTIVNHYSEKQLIEIFYKYGEERRFGKRVARAVMDARKLGGIENTAQLFDIIKRALPASLRFRAGDTARRIFQALRIAVNDELGNLEKALPQAVELLRKSCHSGPDPESIQNGGLDSGFRQNDKTSGGRLVVISFHSLEDRIVKVFLAGQARGCVCPPEFPECVCGKKPAVKILTKKPVVAAEEENAKNSRAKSAKLRAAIKI